MNLDIAVFYWIKEHLQSENLDILVTIFTNQANYLWPGIVASAALIHFRRKQGVAFLVALVAGILVNDFVTHGLLKPLFHRPRPCHTLDLLKNATYVYCSGSYAMPSVMAANITAFAVMVMVFLRKHYWFVITVATAVSLSRVYLGVHYLSDVLVGAGIGGLVGWAAFRLAAPFLGQWDPVPPRIPFAFEPKRILIIKLSSLGDIIHSLPSLHALRQRFPEARISWLVEEKCQDLLYENPELDERIVVRIRHWRKHWNADSRKEARAALRRLRRGRYDCVVELQGLIKTGIIARLTGAPVRVGFHINDCREKLNAWFTTHRIPYIGKKVHVIEKNLKMIEWLGGDGTHKRFPLTIPAEAEARIQRYLADEAPGLADGPLVAVHHGVGFETKRWPLERFAELGDRLAGELGLHVLLTWGPGEEDAVQRLSALMRERHWVSPKNSMHESAALFRRLTLFIGCDTGPMHLSAALGIPTVSLFGPTDPEYSRPHGDNHIVVVKPQPCSFCHRRSCPTHLECMLDISVDDVVHAVRKSLKDNTPTQAN